MTTKNIFTAIGEKGIFINLIYKELMKREFVAYEDVLRLYKKNFLIDFNKATLSAGAGYGSLKKAFPEVIKALEKACPGCIVDNGKKGKGKAFKYIGNNNDPLADERQATEQKSLEEYVMFCKASAGIMPASWFAAFFENTQLLLDANRESQEGTAHIRSGLDQNLTNIHLLPLVYKTITNRKVLRFFYQQFGREAFEITFHPQFLKEYNGRWFVFGDADREPYKAYNVPLDRIIGEPTVIDDIEYIPAEKGFYQQFFMNIIGVTHERDSTVEQVVIRTKTEYQHGLLLTKPLHHSQKELLPFDEHDDGCYGEITLAIEPNRELCGKILAFGQYLEVVQPLSLRDKIKEIIKQQMAQYFDMSETEI